MILTLGVQIINSGHIIGMVVTLLLIIGVGIYASSQVRCAADFSGSSRKAGSPLVAGTIMGTLVGGASTIGTAQLAFQFGLCAWWFTIGAGIGCLALGLAMLGPLYTNNNETVPQYLVGTYGQSIGPVTSIFSSIGMFINIVAQGLAAVALLTAIFHMSLTSALVISVVLVLAYVFGGVQGTGMAGVVKLSLLYMATIVTGLLAYHMFNGSSGIYQAFPAQFPWFSLFGRGFSKDAAAGFSLLVGVLSTQTYIQAVLSAKTYEAARNGALMSAVLIPPIGVGGILVGLFMRANVASFPGLESAQVLPTFVLHYLPPWLGGMIIATLLIAVIGTWAGLSLGVSTMLTRDIYRRFIKKGVDEKKALLVQRALIVFLAIAACYFISGSAGALILSFSFLSMGLRGCTVLFPLMGAIFFKKFVTPAAGMASAILGPLTDFYWAMRYPNGIDPLYPGLLFGFATLIIVSIFTHKKGDLLL